MWRHTTAQRRAERRELCVLVDLRLPASRYRVGGAGAVNHRDSALEAKRELTLGADGTEMDRSRAAGMEGHAARIGAGARGTQQAMQLRGRRAGNLGDAQPIIVQHGLALQIDDAVEAQALLIG